MIRNRRKWNHHHRRSGWKVSIHHLKGEESLKDITNKEKLRRAAEVICKQGMVQFPVSDTAVAIVDRVVGDNEEELDLINAFREKPSQTIDQLGESSRFSTKKLSNWQQALQRKGLFSINQAPPVS